MNISPLKSEYLVLMEFSEETYRRAITNMYNKYTYHHGNSDHAHSVYEKMKITVCNNRYELDVWPHLMKKDGNTINITTKRGEIDLRDISGKEWILSWTRLHEGAIEKLRTMQINQTEVVELGSLRV